MMNIVYQMTAPESNTVDKNSKLWYNKNMSEFYKKDDKGGCAFEDLVSNLEEDLWPTLSIPEKCQDCPYMLRLKEELEYSVREAQVLTDFAMKGARDIQDGDLVGIEAFTGVSKNGLREIIARDAAKEASAQLDELDKAANEVSGELRKLTEPCPGPFTIRAPGIDATVCEHPATWADGHPMLETAVVTRRF